MKHKHISIKHGYFTYTGNGLPSKDLIQAMENMSEMAKKNLICTKCGEKMFDEFTGTWHDFINCDKPKKAFNISTECG